MLFFAQMTMRLPQLQMCLCNDVSCQMEKACKSHLPPTGLRDLQAHQNKTWAGNWTQHTVTQLLISQGEYRVVGHKLTNYFSWPQSLLFLWKGLVSFIIRAMSLMHPAPGSASACKCLYGIEETILIPGTGIGQEVGKYHAACSRCYWRWCMKNQTQDTVWQK